MASFVKESIESSSHKCVGMYDPLGNGNYKDLKEIDTKIDGIIDFSHFSLAEEILKYAIEISSPLVIATTGHTDEQKLKIEEASKKIAILKATNTSLGVNIMNQIVSYATKLLADFDFKKTTEVISFLGNSVSEEDLLLEAKRLFNGVGYGQA